MTDPSAATTNTQPLHMYSWKVVASIFVLGLAIGFLASLVNVQSAVNVLPQTCEYNGKTYRDGEGFKDDCNSCGCSDGQVSCTMIACSGSGGGTGTGVVGVTVAPYESEFKNIPDLTPDSAPTADVPVSYVIEHRSYLNNSTLMVTGTIVRNSTLEEECVGDRCPMMNSYMQPSLWISDTLDESRNPYYDLRVLLTEGLTLPDSYTVGATVTIPVTIVGSSDSIIATYALIADDGVRR